MLGAERTKLATERDGKTRFVGLTETKEMTTQKVGQDQIPRSF